MKRKTCFFLVTALVALFSVSCSKDSHTPSLVGTWDLVDLEKHFNGSMVYSGLEDKGYTFKEFYLKCDENSIFTFNEGHMQGVLKYSLQDNGIEIQPTEEDRYSVEILTDETLQIKIVDRSENLKKTSVTPVDVFNGVPIYGRCPDFVYEKDGKLVKCHQFGKDNELYYDTIYYNFKRRIQ